MIPAWQKPPTPVNVQALREFIAPFGPDVAVLVTWTHEKGYQFVTVGCDRRYADAALGLRNLLVGPGLGLVMTGPDEEDLRAEHRPEPWTQEQKEALARVFDAVLAVLPQIPTEKVLAYIYHKGIEHEPI
jgi:hypothetical protein